MLVRLEKQCGTE